MTKYSMHLCKFKLLQIIDLIRCLFTAYSFKWILLRYMEQCAITEFLGLAN